MRLTGFVLTGGQSSRMGQDKSTVLFGNLTLLQHALEKTNALCAESSILCGSDPSRAANLASAIVDLHPGHGPLSGIEAALSATQTDWNLILPVDVPLLPVSVLRAWIDALDTTASAAILEDEQRKHPLPLLLHRRALPFVQQQLAGQRRSILALLDALQAQVQITPVTSLSPHLSQAEAAQRPLWFAGANTPAQLAHLRLAANPQDASH